MAHLRADPDLAGVRDQDALGKLPPEEAQERRAFWVEVDTLCQRAEDLASK